MRCRACCCLVLAVTVLSAAEPDPRAQVKTVWTEASRAGDLWTCLQAEEWGRIQKPTLKLGPVLGGVVVAGSTLLALPEPIRQFADCGDRVVLTTDRRVWLAAPDGRPLMRSLPLAVVSSCQALGYAGRIVASADLNRPEAGPAILRIAAQAIEDGAQKGPRGMVLSSEHPYERTVRLNWNSSVADDGSAVALDLAGDDPFGRQVVVATSRGQELVPNAWTPTAVGRAGSWVVVYSPGGQDLVRGKRRERIELPVAGPGLAAGFVDKTLRLILADGSDRVLEHGFGLGTDYGLASVGGWLVMGTGWGAKAEAAGDLLSLGSAETQQPQTVVLWRWADLAADPAAKPVATIESGLTVARDQAAGLVLWTGTSIDLLDLSGSEPRRTHQVTTPLPIDWLHCNGNLIVANMAEGRKRVYGPDGAELWAGVAEEVLVKRQDLALTWRPGKEKGHRRWQLQQLSADPAKRSEVQLPLAPLTTEIEVGYRGCDWLVGYLAGHWRQYGFDGQLIDRGGRSPPATIQWDAYAIGRFFRDGGRLLAKTRPFVEATDRLYLQDAWRFGPLTVLLEDRGRVQACLKKRGDSAEIGVISGADRLAMAGKTPVIVAQADLNVVGVLVPGPKAVAEVPPDLPKVEEMPPGPYRLEGGLVFSLPRSGRLRWDTELTGFEPLRLRSPEGAGLFVVTRSALLELDAAAIKAVSTAAP